MRRSCKQLIAFRPCSLLLCAATSSPNGLFERTASCRRAIQDLWNAAQGDATLSSSKVQELLETYKIRADTPREEDLTKGLGDSFDRLLLLTVPLHETNTQNLETLLQCAGRAGREISVRTIQHLFARCGSYAEAIAIFYAMRKANVAMNMEAYHAMLYSLQRLEEESWSQKFAEEIVTTGKVSEQAMDFVLRGCDNQLMPENKPWLGRVMYQDQDVTARKQSNEDFDALGKQWVNRYKAA